MRHLRRTRAIAGRTCLTVTAAVVLIAPAQAPAASALPTAVPAARTADGPPPEAQDIETAGAAPDILGGLLGAVGLPGALWSRAADAVGYAADHTDLAARLAALRPRSGSAYRPEALLARALGPYLVPAGTDAEAVRRDAVAEAFATVPVGDRFWLAATFPGVVGNLAGAPLPERAAANRIRIAAALGAATAPAPPVSWLGRLLGAAPPSPAGRVAALRRMLAPERQFVYFDPDANHGRIAWAELIGRIGPRTRYVGVLVPGTSAYATSDNLDVYRTRSLGLVDRVPDDALAMVVWAAGDWPGGNLQAALRRWDEPLGQGLAAFSRDLRRQVGPAVAITAIGHSYGGAVVGTAEAYGLDVDRVLHVASPGMGVRSPAEYRTPNRPRYAITAPGDPITWFQGLTVGGFGHGHSPDSFPGVVRLATGRLPATVPGEVTGAPIVGRAAHSEVFIPDSGAWLNIYGVLTGGPVRPDAGHRDDSPPVPDREPAVTWVRAAPTRCGKKDPYPTRPPRPRPLAA